MACCAWFSGFAVFDKEEVRIQFEDRTYNVLSSASTLGDDDNYWIAFYECDQHNFLCRKVYDRYTLSTDATLIPDPVAHTVTLAINGESVYVHLR